MSKSPLWEVPAQGGLPGCPPSCHHHVRLSDLGWRSVVWGLGLVTSPIYHHHPQTTQSCGSRTVASGWPAQKIRKGSRSGKGSDPQTTQELLPVPTHTLQVAPPQTSAQGPHSVSCPSPPPCCILHFPHALATLSSVLALPSSWKNGSDWVLSSKPSEGTHLFSG